MSNYHRYYKKGGIYFFTVVTYKRQKLFDNGRFIEMLRKSFRAVMEKRPFVLDAIVVLPDHLHCIWQLPAGDDDYSTRWMLIKKNISSALKSNKNHRGEKFVWQRRFWEHWLRDDKDWRCHMDYIHYNPVKHGYVNKPLNWKYGSFRQAVSKGLYVEHWGASAPSSIEGLHYE